LSVAFGPDGRQLATGSQDKTAIVWNARMGQKLHTLSGHTLWVSSVAFSPDGKQLATGSRDKTAILWGAQTGQKLRTLSGHTDWVHSVAFSPDGRQLATGSGDTTTVLWEARTGQRLRTLSSYPGQVLDDYTAGVRSVAFRPDGRQLATGSYDTTVTLWDAGTGQKVRTLSGHIHPVLSVAFSSDGRQLATGSYEKAAIVWDARTGLKLHTLSSHTSTVHSVAFSPGGRQMATGSDDTTAILWDAQTGQKLRTLSGHTGSVTSAAFSPDGRQLATGSGDGTTRLWDLATGDELGSLLSLDGGKDWLVVTPQGLFDGSEGGRQKVTFRIGTGLTIVPVDRFYQDFARPGLLALLARGLRPMPDIQLGHSRPPSLRIVAPKQAGVIETRQISLEVEATDEGGGIQVPWLLHNGARVLSSEQPLAEGNKLRRRFPVSLVQGNNRLEVKAASSDGSWESEPATLLLRYEKPLDKPRLYLLAVGINRYADDSLSLQFARADAEAMAQLFRRRGGSLYQVAEPIVLLDADATRTKIRQALRDMAQQARTQDTLVVFLAGHGTLIGQRYYFIPHELRRNDGQTLEDDVRQQGLAADVLGDSLAAVPALKRILILDTCASGGAVGLTKTGRNPFAFRGVIEKLGRSQGVFTLAAAAATEEAQEVKALGHGVLSYALLAGLGAVQEGPLKDQAIRPDSPERVASVLEWFSFASGQVPRLSKRYLGREQDVQMSSQGQSFPVLPVEDP
jgi:Tol biopolymer transport system component